VDIQAISTLVLSIVASIVVVVIFREGRDDGTELIIMSKPINHWKIVSAKFVCFLVTAFMIIILAMILALGMFFFGQYDLVKNPNGITPSNVFEIEMGILLATLIIFLFFGSIGILISTVAGKISIMVTTIGIAIVFNLLYTIMPIIAKTPESYVRDKYAVTLASKRYPDQNGVFHDVVNASHVKYFTDDHNDPTNN
jgi:ABC-type transport system involved in multi-copper enzyme maturation permease subunit